MYKGSTVHGELAEQAAGATPSQVKTAVEGAVDLTKLVEDNTNESFPQQTAGSSVPVVEDNPSIESNPATPKYKAPTANLTPALTAEDISTPKENRTPLITRALSDSLVSTGENTVNEAARAAVDNSLPRDNQLSSYGMKNRIVEDNTDQDVEISTKRKDIKDFFTDKHRERKNQASWRNWTVYQYIYRDMRDERGERIYPTYKDWLASGHDVDQEAMPRLLNSLLLDNYSRLNETEEIENPDGTKEKVPAKSPGSGIERKDTSRKDKTIQKIIWAFRVGFFPVYSEHIETITEEDGTIKKNPGWNRTIEDKIKQVCFALGWDPMDEDAQRNVFRLVILRASMSFDRKGKLMDAGQEEWAMYEKPFLKVCNNLLFSINRYGNPLLISREDLTTDKNAKDKMLSGTPMIPAGVMPRVVADAIEAGGMCGSADKLIKECEDQWNQMVHPWMKEYLVNEPDRNPQKKEKKPLGVRYLERRGYKLEREETKEEKPENRVAQRIAVEDFNEAIARIDGMDAMAFSSRYGVDTKLHYTLSEIQDSNLLYATAMYNRFDAKKVQEFQEAQLAIIRQKAKKQKDKKEESAIDAACNIYVSGIKTNALFWQLPIMISAVAEKGVGDLQTDLALKWIEHRTEKITGIKKSTVSQEVKDAFKTHECVQAIDAALLILEEAGPGGLALFSKTGRVLSEKEAIAFLEEYYTHQAKSPNAVKARDFGRKLSKLQQHILTGDKAFRHKDSMNYLNAVLIGNQVLLGLQNDLGKMGTLDERGGQAFSGYEINEAFIANGRDVARLITELIGTPAGRDGLILMRSNNIGNFNPIGFNVDHMLRDHGVTNAMVSTFVDTFPKYGIGFLYTCFPFSRSLCYLGTKFAEVNTRDSTVSMFTPGGQFADVEGMGALTAQLKADEAFRAQFFSGLRLNLIFDSVAMAKWGIVGVIGGAILHALGYEPPEKPGDILNASMWKVAGEEIQTAFWLNDLTQLGLPLMYLCAAALGGYPKEVCFGLFKDSLYDQCDGNVVFDIINLVKNWGAQLSELELMATDPDYVPSGYSASTALMDLCLSSLDKAVPGAPLYRWLGKDTLLRGNEATQADPSRVYDYSESWMEEVGKTAYVTDEYERMIRKHSTSNWLLAAFENLYHSVILGEEKYTGYFWGQMPPRSQNDQLIMTYLKQQSLDYTNRDEYETDYAYEEHMTDILLNQIDDVIREYGGIKQATMSGYAITHDIRYIALNHLSDRLADIEKEFDAMKASGALSGSAYYTAKNDKERMENEIWDYINILRDKDIPTWQEGYNVLLSDYEISYSHSDGTPATGWDYLFDGDVTASWTLKGNHPLTLLPWTTVDTRSTDSVKRGFNGETVNSWYTEGENGGTNLEAIQNTIGQETVPYGRNAGKTLNSVLFGEDAEGNMLHPDQPTTGSRALIPQK